MSITNDLLDDNLVETKIDEFNYPLSFEFKIGTLANDFIVKDWITRYESLDPINVGETAVFEQASRIFRPIAIQSDHFKFSSGHFTCNVHCTLCIHTDIHTYIHI